MKHKFVIGSMVLSLILIGCSAEKLLQSSEPMSPEDTGNAVIQPIVIESKPEIVAPETMPNVIPELQIIDDVPSGLQETETQQALPADNEQDVVIPEETEDAKPIEATPVMEPAGEPTEEPVTIPIETPVEPTVEVIPTIPSEEPPVPSEPIPELTIPPTTSTEPITAPTEPTTEPVDPEPLTAQMLRELEQAGLQYAVSKYGYEVDYSLGFGAVCGYYPGMSGYFNADGYDNLLSLVKTNVDVTTDYLMGQSGPIWGYREDNGQVWRTLINIAIVDDGGGSYTVWVFYG